MITPRTIIEILSALVAAFLVWHYAKPQSAPVGTWTVAKPAPELARVPTQTLQCKPVVVYSQAAKSKLNLPSTVQADTGQYVLNAAQVPAALRPQTMTTMLDERTGKSVVLVKSDPYPWIAAENTRELRLDYGFKRGFDRVGRLSFTDDLLQVKGVHLGGSISADTDGSLFIGGGLSYRW